MCVIDTYNNKRCTVVLICVNLFLQIGTFENALSFTGKGINRWVFKDLEFTEYMLSGTNISDVNLSQWNVAKVTNVGSMFQNTPSFVGNGISNWNTIKFNFLDNMFDNATLFDADLRTWNVGNVSSMQQMFARTKKFRGIGLDQWNMSRNVIVEKMFCDADGLVIKDNLTSSWTATAFDNAFKC